MDDLSKALGLDRYIRLNKASYWTHTDGTKWWHNPKTNKVEPYTGNSGGDSQQDDQGEQEQAPVPAKNDDVSGNSSGGMEAGASDEAPVEGAAGSVHEFFSGLPQSFPPPPKGKKLAYGGLIISPEKNAVLMRKVAGSYGGYVWTFAKGGQDAGESPEQTANREVQEEMGISCKIRGTLPKWFEGDTSATAFYVMEYTGNESPDQFKFGEETEKVEWVDTADIKDYIDQTESKKGRERDNEIADLIVGRLSQINMKNHEKEYGKKMAAEKAERKKNEVKQIGKFTLASGSRYYIDQQGTPMDKATETLKQEGAKKPFKVRYNVTDPDAAIRACAGFAKKNGITAYLYQANKYKHGAGLYVASDIKDALNNTNVYGKGQIYSVTPDYNVTKHEIVSTSHKDEIAT